MPLETIQLNGAELSYWEEGDGVPLVFVHGMLGDYRSWRRQTSEFSKTYRTIALSQRYYRPNSWPTTVRDSVRRRMPLISRLS
jgi:pimeloyl-ACP methyl ester carboxylesterase